MARAIIGFLILLLASLFVPQYTTAAAQPDLTIDDLIDRVTTTLMTIDDLSMKVEMTQYNTQDGTELSAQGVIMALLPDLFRLTYEKPDMFADQIYVLDRRKQQIRTYIPITEQVIIEPIERVASERGLQMNVERLLSMGLPSPGDYNLALDGSKTTSGRTFYVVSATKKGIEKPLIYRFLIDSKRWMVSGAELLSPNGNPIFTMRFYGITLNQGLTEKQLLQMPEGADEVYR